MSESATWQHPPRAFPFAATASTRERLADSLESAVASAASPPRRHQAKRDSLTSSQKARAFRFANRPTFLKSVNKPERRRQKGANIRTS